MAPAKKEQPADESNAPTPPADGEQGSTAPDTQGGGERAADGGEQGPEPKRDESEEQRLLRELEGTPATDDMPAAVRNTGRNPRRVGYTTLAPGATHKFTDRERENPRLMAKARHAMRSGFLTAVK